MAKRSIHITVQDMKRLSDLLMVEVAKEGDTDHIERLGEELDRASLVPADKVPGDVVTMNSKVRVADLGAGEDKVLTVVFPGDANAAEGKVSVLTPMGTAILGFKVGDTIKWQVPEGALCLRIEEIVYQPEAAGDYHL